MAAKSEVITVVLTLSWDGGREDPRAALADTFAAMAKGVRAGKRTGLLSNGGEWRIRDGAERWCGDS